MMGVAASMSVSELPDPSEVSALPMLQRPSAVRLSIRCVSKAVASLCAVARGSLVAWQSSARERGWSAMVVRMSTALSRTLMPLPEAASGALYCPMTRY